MLSLNFELVNRYGTTWTHFFASKLRTDAHNKQ